MLKLQQIGYRGNIGQVISLQLDGINGPYRKDMASNVIWDLMHTRVSPRQTFRCNVTLTDRRDFSQSYGLSSHTHMDMPQHVAL